jgi:hypothetical protein
MAGVESMFQSCSRSRHTVTIDITSTDVSPIPAEICGAVKKSAYFDTITTAGEYHYRCHMVEVSLSFAYLVV